MVYCWQWSDGFVLERSQADGKSFSYFRPDSKTQRTVIIVETNSVNGVSKIKFGSSAFPIVQKLDSQDFIVVTKRLFQVLVSLREHSSWSKVEFSLPLGYADRISDEQYQEWGDDVGFDFSSKSTESVYWIKK